MFLYWITMILCHEIITVSAATRNQIRSWPFIQDKITVIHNGIDKEAGFARKNARLEFTRANESVKKAIEGVPESNLIWIGTVAELHPIKGHEYAIRAIHECIHELKRSRPSHKIIYTILGDGEKRVELQKLIIELGLVGNVFLMGHVDGAAQFVKAFDIFLLASLSEGLCYVLLEAGAASLPVITTAVGGIPEIISDMESGILVQPRNSRELAHAALFMAEHPDDSKKYGAALKHTIMTKFSLDEMTAKTAKIYSNVLNEQLGQQ